MRILTTGLTLNNHGNNGDEEDRICYLCKRREGEDSFTLQGVNGDLETVFRPIELDMLAFTIPVNSQKVEMQFLLCLECQVLLGVNPFEEEERQGWLGL